MPTVKVVEDLEDEVNIAQFHPMPGYGVVYGTKRGKTRAFVLPK
jgi:activator-of-BECN1-regulated-autophagy protein 1